VVININPKKTMMITHKTLITDPGHAWLAIDRAELDELGIAQLISSYSYEFKTDDLHLVLLEEDCDMTTYLRHKFDDPEEWRAFVRECDEPATILILSEACRTTKGRSSRSCCNMNARRDTPRKDSGRRLRDE
tara:strand:- start:189 stop:587 length:399 start_codon:yes stop_codon:yes gene_type:complete